MSCLVRLQLLRVRPVEGPDAQDDGHKFAPREQIYATVRSETDL